MLGDTTISAAPRVVAAIHRVRRVVSVGMDAGRCGGLHRRIENRRERLGALDDPGISPHFADVLRLPDRLSLRMADGVPRPFRSGADPGLPRVEHRLAHLNDYEGNPARRPFSYDELQALFDYLDERVDRVAHSGRKGALVALRDA